MLFLSATKSLVRMLLFDSSDIVRLQSVEAFGRIRMTNIIYEDMVDGLKGSDESVRYSYIRQPQKQ